MSPEDYEVSSDVRREQSPETENPDDINRVADDPLRTPSCA
jgi:hypothetical protein